MAQKYWIRSSVVSSFNNWERVPRFIVPRFNASMVLTSASQDFTHAALPIFLPYTVIRLHLWLWKMTTSEVQNPDRQLRKPTLKPSQTTPDHPVWPRQPTFRPCPEAGSRLGTCPILLSHLCLQDLRVGPTPGLSDTNRYLSSNTQKHSPGLGFCFILLFLLLIHYFVFLC